MTTRLTSTATIVPGARLRITAKARGANGTIAVLAPPANAGPERGGGAASTGALDDALAEAGFATLVDVALALEPPPPAVAGVRGTAPVVELRTDAPPAGVGRVALVIDEAGAVTWQLGRTVGAEQVYTIDAAPTTAPPAETTRTRGLLSALGRRIVRFLGFKLAGHGVAWGIGLWESKRRRARPRQVTLADWDSDDSPDLEAGDERWTSLRGGRALLLVHGTFSRTHKAFAGFDPAARAALHQQYGGRIVAFDHATMSETPEENVQKLVAALPNLGEGGLEVDVVCHSRGGIVTREIARTVPSLRIRRAVFVGCPHGGTPLCNPTHMGTMLDLYTSLMNAFPDNAITAVLDAILAAVKELTIATLAALKGLRSMEPGGPYLTSLASGAAPHFDAFAVASDFENAGGALSGWLADKIMDGVFLNEPNDLVVPTHGAWAHAGPGFPEIAADRRLVLPSSNVIHTQYFAQSVVADRVLGWLR